MSYAVKFVGGRRIVELMEASVSSDERRFTLVVDGASLTDLSFLPYYSPGVAVTDGHVAVWAGARIYIVPSDGAAPRAVEMEEEVLAAYFVGGSWCLVCETSVVTLDRSYQVAVKFEHCEVFTRCWWDGGELIVLDFQGSKMSFSESSLVSPQS